MARVGPTDRDRYENDPLARLRRLEQELAELKRTALTRQGPGSGLDADTLDGTHLADIESIPAGVIVMWSGAVVDIPDGWALCDGVGGRPNLRDRFIVGAGAAYNPGDKGGSPTLAHTHSVDVANYSGNSGSVGNHRHWADPPAATTNGGNFWSAGGWGSSNRVGEGSQHHNHTVDVGGFNTNYAGGHSHTINHNHPAVTSGGASEDENRPPYYALAFIIKL